MAYTSFAEVYDTFMDNVPYGEWCGYLTGLLRDFGVSDGLVAELGCGTGTMTELLSACGYDMIGVDSSEDMLSMAMEKRDRSGSDILYLCQDMRELELYGTVRAVVCVCDSLNYLLEEEELKETFALVNNYLDPGGLFLFDFNTPYKYGTVIGDCTIAENRDDCSFIWENYYEKDSGLNEYDLTIFVREEGGLFRRFTETHVQRGYAPETVRRLAQEEGLCWAGAMDADTGGPVGPESERIFAVAKEQGKDGNSKR